MGSQALHDECEALNAIYCEGTVELSPSSADNTTAVLKLPGITISFQLAFPRNYPDVPPSVLGTVSTGSSGKGEGERAVATLVETLSEVYAPGTECLYDLVEAAVPRLEDHKHDSAQNTTKDASNRSHSVVHHMKDEDHPTPVTVFSIRAPPWIISEPTIVNKSTFVARALRISSMTDVTEASSHLLSTNKKVATATHNIKAWRFQAPGTNVGVVQDYDDDGETAAGGRLLHLMQLMDVMDVLVIVTRWYGGVKLGPDRFRIINNVAREALSSGGFVKDEKSKSKKDKK